MYLILFIFFILLGLIVLFIFFMSNSFMEFNIFPFFINICVTVLIFLSLLSFVLEFWLFLKILLFFYSVLNVVFANVNFSFFFFVSILYQAFVIFFIYCLYSKYSSLFVLIYLVYSNSFGVTSMVLLHKVKGDSCVFSYNCPNESIVLGISCFSSGVLSVNFFCEDGSLFIDNFSRFSSVYQLEMFVNRKVSFALFSYSVHVYGEILKASGGNFMSYWEFVSFFMMYVNSVFHSSSVSVKKGVYFDSVSLSLNLEFWLKSLDANGEFSDSFVKYINKNSHSYKTMNFKFLMEMYDPDNIYHTSSPLVPHSSLYSDFDYISHYVKVYFGKANSFVSMNNSVLKKSYNLSQQDMDILFSDCSNNPDYEVFLKYYSWS